MSVKKFKIEPVEKTLENLEKGDLVKYKNIGTKKVLAVLDGCYLLSHLHDHLTADGWYTPYELEVGGWKFVHPEFEEAVKDLEPID